MKPNDRYDGFYAEKIWQLLPEFYRHEDGLLTWPGALREFVDALGVFVAASRRSNDQLWEDQFIEFCHDWAVSYIGSTVGTRMLSPENLRGRRIDVARTISYRRRRGTMPVLEGLVNDITGWDAKVVEQFKRMARPRNLLDAPPQLTRGWRTGTYMGGTANLHNPRSAELVDTGWGEFAHLATLVRGIRHNNRYDLKTLSYHLFRLLPWWVQGVTPYRFPEAADSTCAIYSFDPSGRAIPLFQQGDRPEQWQPLAEADAPKALDPGAMNEVEFRFTEAAVTTLLQQPALTADDRALLEFMAGMRFLGQGRMQAWLRKIKQSDPASYGNITIDTANFYLLIQHAQTARSDRKRLFRSSQPVLDVSPDLDSDPPDLTAYYGVGDICRDQHFPGTPTIAVEPHRGLFRFTEASGLNVNSPFTRNSADDTTLMEASYHFATPAPIGAGPWPRFDLAPSPAPSNIFTGGGEITGLDSNGVYEIADSNTYTFLQGKTITATSEATASLTLQAKNGERPYLCIRKDEQASDCQIKAGVESTYATFDGVWFGVPNKENCMSFMDGGGTFDTITIRHCTFDPGGKTFEPCNGTPGKPVYPVVIKIAGTVDHLIIEDSIVSRIEVTGTLNKLTVRNSIIQLLHTGASQSSTGDPVNLITTVPANISEDIHFFDSAGFKPYALNLPDTEAHIERSTIIGHCAFHQLYASESIFVGTVNTEDLFNGCFRYSAVARDNGIYTDNEDETTTTTIPKPYRDYRYAFDEQGRFFTSLLFGNPAYGQISQRAPAFLHTGSEARSTIGAYCNDIETIKTIDLRSKIEEYSPIDAEALLIRKN